MTGDLGIGYSLSFNYNKHEDRIDWAQRKIDRLLANNNPGRRHPVSTDLLNRWGADIDLPNERLMDNNNPYRTYKRGRVALLSDRDYADALQAKINYIRNNLLPDIT